ncbi:MAG TPA: hypothetical protein VFQ60_04320 [Patescibacteria group bacterium]|nr:hypothetical protein [Patescibacteria group bacterium]
MTIVLYLLTCALLSIGILFDLYGSRRIAQAIGSAQTIRIYAALFAGWLSAGAGLWTAGLFVNRLYPLVHAACPQDRWLAVSFLMVSSFFLSLLIMLVLLAMVNWRHGPRRGVDLIGAPVPFVFRGRPPSPPEPA